MGLKLKKRKERKRTCLVFQWLLVASNYRFLLFITFGKKRFYCYQGNVCYVRGPFDKYIFKHLEGFDL